MKQFRGYLNYHSLIEWNTKTDVYDTCYRQMKHSERIAYKYILEKGYKEEEISFYFMKSPDFITSDGKGWEIKTYNGNYVLFTALQSRMPMDTNILIVDNSGKITESIFKDCINQDNIRFVLCRGYGNFDDAILEMERRDENERYWESKMQLLLPNRESKL